ncbi:MAG: hypothetical protein V8R80_12870 [Eubacterium sp.]
MDAHYDPKLQIAQLDALKLQKPDAIIGIAVDENLTADKFKALSKTIKMIFVGNVPPYDAVGRLLLLLRFGE